MHNNAVRLENSDDTIYTGATIQSGIVSHEPIMNDVGMAVLRRLNRICWAAC